MHMDEHRIGTTASPINRENLIFLYRIAERLPGMVIQYKIEPHTREFEEATLLEVIKVDDTHMVFQTMGATKEIRIRLLEAENRTQNFVAYYKIGYSTIRSQAFEARFARRGSQPRAYGKTLCAGCFDIFALYGPGRQEVKPIGPCY